MKKDFVYSLLIFSFCLAIDQVTKSWGLTLETLQYNEGVIFGLYGDLSKALRIITLCSIFGFLFFLYLILLYLLPAQLKQLKYGLSLLMGGIFGNVLDRTLWGKSIDFIPFHLADIHLVFNFADVFQWIGAAIIIYKVIKKEKVIWYPDNQRGRYLINPKEQILFSIKFSSIAFCSSLLLGIFSFTFFRTTLTDWGFRQYNQVLASFAISYICLSLAFTLLVFIAGLIISHKSSGPLYAFELYVEDLLKGERRKLVLRDGDNYRHLEQVADQLEQHFKKEDEDNKGKAS
ncbi:MAG: signal peptidase II [Bacteriovoracaceae bacterium]|jgi:signal peptidase II